MVHVLFGCKEYFSRSNMRNVSPYIASTLIASITITMEFVHREIFFGKVKGCKVKEEKIILLYMFNYDKK